MAYLIDDGLKPEEAGEKAIKTDAKRLDAWLANVKTFDGNPAADQVRAALGL
jgi:glycine betaine/proline transport system substrate-binding protein